MTETSKNRADAARPKPRFHNAQSISIQPWRSGVQSEQKPSNPKEHFGNQKPYFSTIPGQVLGELGLAMLEGAVKYRRHNYRVVGVKASTYFDAAQRHLLSWWEGEDIDPESGASHLVKAMACLVVVRDAELQDVLVDDRPPPERRADWMADLADRTKALLAKYPEPKPPCTKDDYIP